MRTGFLKKNFSRRFLYKKYFTVRYVLSFFFTHYFLKKLLFQKFSELLNISNFFKAKTPGKNICYFSLRQKGGEFYFKASRHLLRPFIYDNYGMIKAI